MLKSTHFMVSALAAALLASSVAWAQPGATPAPQPKVFAFPEASGPPPPPGAPTIEDAIAAYLRGRSAAPAGGGAAGGAAADRASPTPSGRVLPPILTIGPVPDASHIRFTLPDDIPWRGREGQNQTWNIFGSPNEPGPYLQLMKWWPGAYSTPHMHPNTRNVIVLSGTWWVSSSATQDKTQTYPLPAGTHVVEAPYTSHWDGARNEPAILMLWGNGPSPNIPVDSTGRPRARSAPAPSADQ